MMNTKRKTTIIKWINIAYQTKVPLQNVKIALPNRPFVYLNLRELGFAQVLKKSFLRVLNCFFNLW